jgi:hypothetical protein
VNTSWYSFAQRYLLLGLAGLQQTPVRVSSVTRSRQLIVATIGFIAMIAIPALAIYYARKRWRP